jgi:hypothetical protein
VVAGEVGGGAVPGGEQRPQAGEGADDVLGVSGTLQRAAEHRQQEGLVGLVGQRLVGHGVDRIVGQPDVDPPVGLGQGEDVAVGLAGDGHGQRGAGVAEPGAVEHQVGALRGRSSTSGWSRSAHTPVAFTTWRARISRSCPAELVVDPGAVAGDLLGAGVGEDPRAEGGGGAGDGHHQPGVVGELAVPGQQAAAQPVAGHAGHQQPGVVGAHPAGRGQGGPGGAGGDAQQVAGAKPAPVTAASAGVNPTPTGASIPSARVRCGAVRSISTPRSTALSWASPSWPWAR